MRKVLKIFVFVERNFERFFGCLLLTIISVAMVLNVFFRYVLRSPLSWPYELIGILFVWMVYLGASYGIRESAHIRITHHITLLPLHLQKVVRIVSDICWILFSIFMIVEGMAFVQSMFRFRYITPVFGFSNAYIYLAIPVCYALMTLRLVKNIVFVLTNRVPPYNIRQQKQLLD